MIAFLCYCAKSLYHFFSSNVILFKSIFQEAEKFNVRVIPSVSIIPPFPMDTNTTSSPTTRSVARSASVASSSKYSYTSTIRPPLSPSFQRSMWFILLLNIITGFVILCSTIILLFSFVLLYNTMKF